MSALVSDINIAKVIVMIRKHLCMTMYGIVQTENSRLFTGRGQNISENVQCTDMSCTFTSIVVIVGRSF